MEKPPVAFRLGVSTGETDVRGGGGSTAGAGGSATTASGIGAASDARASAIFRVFCGSGDGARRIGDGDFSSRVDSGGSCGGRALATNGGREGEKTLGGAAAALVALTQSITTRNGP
jgi:hypothetical protein